MAVILTGRSTTFAPVVCLRAACISVCVLSVGSNAYAQSADNSALQALPPPPPPDPTPTTDPQPQAPAVSTPTAAAVALPGAIVATTPPPPPPPSNVLAGIPLPVFSQTVSSDRRAERRYRRLGVVLHDFADDDRAHYNAAGYPLLIGGIGMGIAAGLIEIFPPTGLSPTLVHVYALSFGTIALTALVPGILLLARRSPYENLAVQYDQDQGSPQQRYAATISRWQSMVASERSSQRISAITTIVLGVLMVGSGIAQVAGAPASFGTGTAQAALPFVLGGMLIPMGIFTLNLRPESERSLRAFQFAQGDTP